MGKVLLVKFHDNTVLKASVKRGLGQRDGQNSYEFADFHELSAHILRGGVTAIVFDSVQELLKPGNVAFWLSTQSLAKRNKVLVIGLTSTPRSPNRPKNPAVDIELDKTVGGSDLVNSIISAINSSY